MKERNKAMKETKNKSNEKTAREEYLYHNTEQLLKKYREVVLSIEASLIHTKLNFELEMGCELGEFLEMSYVAGADLAGTKINEQIRTLERNKNMLKIIESAVDILRRRHADGEMYYWILYYTYLSEKPCKTVENIIDKVSEKTEFMSWKTYFKRKQKAIESLSSILWGFTSKECLDVLKEFESDDIGKNDE